MLSNPPSIRPRAECVRSDNTGTDTSNCNIDHACRHAGSGIGQAPAHYERRALVPGIKRVI